jgi:hypothetical protein
VTWRGPRTLLIGQALEMAGHSGRRCQWVAIVALSVLAPMTAVAAGATPAVAAAKKGSGSGSGSGSATASPKLAQSGHTTFWDCPATTTVLLVAVNTLILHPGTALDISFTVRNGATASCNYTAPYAGVAPGPTSNVLTAGPCGSVGYEIQGPHHHNVWPGAQVVNCPALGFAQLAAGATVSGTGSWNQTKPNSSQRVPPGNYTLVVENKHFTFPLHVLKS